MNLSQQIIEAIQSVIGPEPAILHEPYFGGNEETYVADCIRTGWVSSVGAYVDRFEEMLQEMTGAKKAIAVSNGTSGLFIALKLAGVDRNDEVLIPAFTFVATANAVSHCGAVPHLVDIEPETLGVDPDTLASYLEDVGQIKNGQFFNQRTGRRISALMPMHTFGHPAKIDELLAVADRFYLTLVEDAAESLGSTYRGKHTGTFGKLGVISFNGNKICTTGGGGAILTNDIELGKRAKHLTTTAKVAHEWKFFHDEVGYNFRMPNLNAALGCAQLEQLDDFVSAKRRLAQNYLNVFEQIDGVRTIPEPANCHSNYWLNSLLVNNAQLRNEMLATSNATGLMTRPGWELMSELPMYRDVPQTDLANARLIQSCLINIPSGMSIAKRISETAGRASC